MCRENQRTVTEYRVNKITGKLFVLSGPSGVGKGTLREHALENFSNLVYSISCTTREPREGETNGVEYRFISRDEFEQGINNNLFLEYARVHEHYYGTLKSDVIRELNAGRNVLLEIDVQGALQVREKINNAVLIFIAPPSIEELSRRLINRNTESQHDLNIRLSNAVKELKFADKYDYIIVNDDLDLASRKLQEIFTNESR
ncbi:MAG: guanylate kinase [Synergistaceae bacterium]|nr:guanylate kinase [Synergistaceae bacterium]